MITAKIPPVIGHRQRDDERRAVTARRSFRRIGPPNIVADYVLLRVEKRSL
jgi:hypothetical protein